MSTRETFTAKAEAATAVTTGFRADIQALRAVAVALVVVYHYWSNLMPGGYVGVDVFFVISGFLITTGLVASADRPGGLSLLGFYARRVRRLLPAALLVLVVSTIFVVLWIPETQWHIYLTGIVASATYVENWSLAVTSTNYLTGSISATNIAQHYWSLSTEEQFYLVWPLLILLGVWLSTRRGKRNAVAWVLVTVTLASLVTSIIWTNSNASVAYFATPARAWEFGFGGLVALLARRSTGFAPRWLRAYAASLGIVAILLAAVLFDATTVFPGWIAIIPAGGAAAVIWANQPYGDSVRRIVGFRPIQLIGDWSYAIYLWHWPLRVVGLALATTWAIAEGYVNVLCLSLTLVLSGLTRTFIERPVINAGRALLPRWSSRRIDTITLVAMVLAVALACMPALVVEQVVKAQTAAQKQQLADALTTGGPCFGAAALAHPDECASAANGSGSFVPGLLIAGSDQSPADGCQNDPRSPILNCEFGPADGTPVALVGDSHATQWIPAISAAAVQFGWHVTTYLSSGCPLYSPDLVQAPRPGCAARQAQTLSALQAGHYRYVFTSGRPDNAHWSMPTDPAFEGETSTLADAYVQMWQDISAIGPQVVVISNTPDPAMSGVGDVPTCIERHSSAACSLPRASALAANNALSEAVERDAQVSVVNMNALICPGTGDCPAIIGGVLVYSDNSHLTKTYVSTLSPEFSRRVSALMGNSG